MLCGFSERGALRRYAPQWDNLNLFLLLSLMVKTEWYKAKWSVICSVDYQRVGHFVATLLSGTVTRPFVGAMGMVRC